MKVKFFGKEFDNMIKDAENVGMAKLYTNIPCENALTVRTLNNAFSDVIGEGHCVNENSSMIGTEIFFEEDFVLEWFCPVTKADEKLLKMYEKQFKKVKRK